MYTVSDLKRGLVLEYEGAPFVVESLQTSSPSARGGNTITKVKMRNLLTKQRAEKSFRGSETFGVPDVDKRPVQFLYSDPSGFHFMDSETFEQFAFSADDLEWEAKFLREGLEGLRAMFHDGIAIALALRAGCPIFVSEIVLETARTDEAPDVLEGDGDEDANDAE